MIERPILFSTPMVRAILEGRKTQTRRVIKQKVSGPETINDAHAICQDGCGDWIAWFGRGGEFGGRLFKTDAEYAEFTLRAYPNGGGFACRYGKPGDRLWVRETFAVRLDCKPGTPKAIQYLAYKESGVDLGAMWHSYSNWKPSIHMPRWASRITLEVVNVRAERLQAITNDDAKAEGVNEWNGEEPGDFCGEFRELWDSINSDRGYGWEANPWVWVVEFKTVTQEATDETRTA